MLTAASKDQRLIALNGIFELLRRSDESVYSAMTVSELVEATLQMREVIEDGPRREIGQKVSILIAPTGALQETAIDNGWGDEFLKLAKQLEWAP